MTHTILLVVIVSFSAVCAYFAWKIYRVLCDSWVFYDNLLKETQDMNKDICEKMNEMLAFAKLTFNQDFAKRLEETIKGKYNTTPTTMVLCDDGKERELPIEHGW